MENNEQIVKQKSNKGVTILLIVIIIILLGLSGYLAYDKFMVKDTKPAVNDTTKTTDTATSVDSINKEISKERGEYYIKVDSSTRENFYNKTLGTFLINDEKKEVRFNELKGEEPVFELMIGDKSILKKAVVESGLPSFVALMDEKYIVMFFEGGSANRMVLYDLNGNGITSFGNSLGEIEVNANYLDIIDSLIIDDKNLMYYDCKFNNGPGTEELTQYNINFENGKYTEKVISTKQNVTCLVGG